jgi:hypothetical protein
MWSNKMVRPASYCGVLAQQLVAGHHEFLPQAGRHVWPRHPWFLASRSRSQPDPPIIEILLLPSKPPRPDKGSTRETGSEDSQKQTTKPLFRVVAAGVPTISTDQRSKRAAVMNPKNQISPWSRSLLQGKEPKLLARGRDLHLLSTRRPAPLLRLPSSATLARSALDQPDALCGALRKLICCLIFFIFLFFLSFFHFGL